MPPVVHRALLRLFAALPRRVRRILVRWGAPSYTVGAVAVVRRDDGRILLVRQRYRVGWGLPGGLLSRREAPEDAVRREVAEEVGLDVAVDGEPRVVVDPGPQRVDVVYLADLAPGVDPDAARPVSAEIVEVRWCALDGLPNIQHETRTALAAVTRRTGTGPDGPRGGRH